MRIVDSQYSIAGRYLEIFLSGCNHKNGCSKTCHNKFMWDFSVGIEWKQFQLKLMDKILSNIDMIDMLIVTGGEPLDQRQDELLEFIIFLKTFKLPICIFTSYSFNDVSELVKKNVDMIKCGEFNIDFLGDKDVGYFTLASTNQLLYIKENDGIWAII